MFKRMAWLGAALVSAALTSVLTVPVLAHAPVLITSAAGNERSVKPVVKPAHTTPKPTKTAKLSDQAKAPQPVGVAGPWDLEFRDNFSGGSLNLDKWRPNWLGGTDRAVTKPINKMELACDDPSQVKVAEGSLQLTAVSRPCLADNGQVYPFTSGLVQSKHDYQFTYGFAEARMYLPPNTNPALGMVGSCGPNWAAFWLNGQKWPDDGEIDVMECLGHDNVAWNYHWAGGLLAQTPAAWNGTMPSAGWHTFGVDWEPGSLTFYYDGVEVGTVTQGVAATPHYLIANLSISGSNILVPQTLKIDYIRVWKR